MEKSFETLFNSGLEILNRLVAIVIGLAVIGFMWGIVKILFSQENQVAKKEGREYMMYGILALFVMTSVWGLVNLLSETITPEAEVDYINPPEKPDASDFPTPRDSKDDEQAA